MHLTATLSPRHLDSIALRFRRSRLLTGVFLGVLLLATQALGQIAVEGLQDRQILTDRARFRVPATASFATACRLNGATVSTDHWLEVTNVGYHELEVRRVPTVGGVEELRQVRFVVRSAERGSTELGLPPWTPFPVIDSSAAELAGAKLRLITPAAWPVGLEMPVIAVLENDQGSAWRANVLLPTPTGPGLQLRRGAGSGWFPAPEGVGNIDWHVQSQGLEARRSIIVETDTRWKEVAGTLDRDTTWEADERVAITNDLTIPAGVTLSIKAGAIARLAAGVDLNVNGRVVIEGEGERPVVFVPERSDGPWGGFILRGASAEVIATHGVFARSGANPAWFSENPGYDVHRREQALFLVDGAKLALTHCVAFDLEGQFGHGKNGFVTLDHCLVQRCITGGEYNGGSVRLADSWLIECPGDDGAFADADNDGIYFTTGTHEIRDSVIGWTKDDGIDHGSGGAGSLSLSNVWVESTFHEAYAWSGGGRVIRMTNCVALNCGQGLEAGWSTGSDSPDVFADGCLSAGNVVGARFGDNYDWTYSGFLRVTNSFLLFNLRDVWGMNWDDWTYRTNQMNIRGNHLSAPNPLHPDNRTWTGEIDGWRLAALHPTHPGAAVGVGFAVREAVFPASGPSQGVPVRLSGFATNSVTVDYHAESPAQPDRRGTLEFLAGETVKWLPLSPESEDGHAVLHVTLTGGRGIEVTGLDEVWRLPVNTNSSSGGIALIPTGSEWRYLDDGSDPGDAWRGPEFDDQAWKRGPAELGYGENDEATTIGYGPDPDRKYPTTYFRRAFGVPDASVFSRLIVRLKRDDGGAVYLNGREVLRSNLPDGPLTPQTRAANAGDDGKEFFEHELDPRDLRPGDNLVAVEIHQDQPTSSDVSFELELRGVTAPAELRLSASRYGGRILLWWDDAAARLESAPDLSGTWVETPSPAGHALMASEGVRFHRLKRQP
ncbi:MAG: hypothetical protein ACYDC1_06390 [Limisphaerales bacterium]